MRSRPPARLSPTLAALLAVALCACVPVAQVVQVTQVVPITQVVQVTQVMLVTEVVEVRRLVDVTPVATPVPTGGLSFQVTVLADRDWQPAGIDLPPAVLLTVTHTSGQWTFNQRGGDKYLVGPEGYLGNYYSSLDGQCWPAPMPEENKGALIGRIGSGQPFPVGASLSLQVEAGGPLVFRINDDCMGDNDGSLTLQVGVIP